MNYPAIVLVGGIAILALLMLPYLGRDVSNWFGQENAEQSGEEGNPTMPEMPLPPAIPTPPQPTCPEGTIASGVWSYNALGQKVAFIRWECKPMTKVGIGGGIFATP